MNKPNAKSGAGASAISILLMAGLMLAACKPAVEYDNKDAKSMLKALNHAVGGSARLKALRDVRFTYDYNQVSKGTKDVSVETYIFANEFSRGDYSTHQVNVAPQLKGKVTQALHNGKPFFIHEGKQLKDPKLLGATTFLRKANYFWFTMMFKLTDPQTVTSVLPQRKVGNTTYDVVKVSYDAAKTGKKLNDSYILYINPKTRLVDQFLFSLPAFGVKEPVLLFEVEYAEAGGIKYISKRTMFGTDGKGNKKGPAQTIQTVSNIKFNNGFTAAQLLPGK